MPLPIPEEGHFFRISAETADIPADPVQGTDLVEQAQIAAFPVGFSSFYLGKIYKAEDTDPVIDGYRDHVLYVSVQNYVRRTKGPTIRPNRRITRE